MWQCKTSGEIMCKRSKLVLLLGVCLVIDSCAVRRDRGISPAEGVLYERVPDFVLIESMARSHEEFESGDATYVGLSDMAAQEGIALSYGANTQERVIRFGDDYYRFVRGEWYGSATAVGPWRPVRSVPREVRAVECVELGLFHRFGLYQLCAINHASH